MDTTVTRSYRLTEDIHDKIKEIAVEIGGSQQQTISKLIESYELQKGKVALPERQNDIETFENYATSMTKMYMALLTENENKASLIHTQFESQLTSKDSVIKDLQQQLSDSKETEKKAVAELDALQSANEQLNDSINKLNSIIADKEQLNTALAETVEKQKDIIAGMKEKINEVETLQSDVVKYQNALNDVKREMEQQALRYEKDMLSLEKQLQADKISEVAKYQDLYFGLLQNQKHGDEDGQSAKVQEQEKEEVKEVKKPATKSRKTSAKKPKETTSEKND